MATETAVKASESFALSAKATQAIERRDVKTILNYYRNPGDGSPPTPVYVGGNTVTNERPTAPTPVIVHDITGMESTYLLDTHGFQLIKHQSENPNFDDEEWLKTKYYRECAEVYKKATGASRVHLFGHLVRRGPTHWHSLGIGNATKKGPLHRVHIDQSYSGAELVLRKQLPSEYESILASRCRWQIINLWRPIRTIHKDPLAVGAAHTFAEKDLIQAEVIYTKQEPPLNKNQTWTILPSERHEWHYKNEQNPDEVLLIKCFDSKIEDGLARRAPHCAFVDEERRGKEWEDRESVEIRALVFYDD
ncbi:hypothetical protein CC78DRAFT_81312 [Lojkania enalia]|uniref:GA4 desaturase n=1 Tax=Lojkania enalia TaxID=147567 RepID=A0A9P4JXZ6_9PLEO|nr:hypothetical protein CC78DRAFT_81312 [Didymosphaeria enalia]